MKFIALTGGLGNQMFIYAFYEELKSRGQKAILFVQYRTNSKKYGHQGYELEKLFPVISQKEKESTIPVFLLICYGHLLRTFPVQFREALYRLIRINVVTVPENFIYYPEVFALKNNHELFRGTWQSEKYFEHAKESVRKTFTFNEKLLNDSTLLLSKEMAKTISVSIHIRRGDYLSAQYVNGFSGICTIQYYVQAVKIMKDKYPDAKFYVFTDDPQWVNEHIKIENAEHVQHNIGKDSWQDMYLMSQCKHNIIANSSFSWWGAWLNNNPDKIVIAPKTWWNGFLKDDVVPENWIRI